MTDQTTAPPATVPVDTDPVWRRLVMDCAALQRAYPAMSAPHLAELVRQAILAGVAFARSARYDADRPDTWPTDAQVIAMVMHLAAAFPAERRTAALHALAHAGQRERAARHARTETPAVGETNGGNCGG